MKKVRIFIRVTPFNVILIWLGCLQGEVYYAESVVSPRLLWKARPIILEDEISLDDWCRLSDEASQRWKNIYDSLPRSKWKIRIHGVEIDFRRLGMQYISMEFWKFLLLQGIIKRSGRFAGKKAVIVSTLYLDCLRSGLPDGGSEVFGETLKISYLNVFLGCLFDWSLNLRDFASVLKSFVISLITTIPFRKKDIPRHKDILFISSLPAFLTWSNEVRSDFWPLQKGICGPEDILYVTADQDLIPAQKEPAPMIKDLSHLIREFSFSDSMRGLTKLFQVVLSNLFRPWTAERVICTAFAIRVIPWYWIWKNYRFRAALYDEGIIGLFEPPFAALFNSLAVRTLVWAFAQSTSLWDNSYDLKDKRIPRSMIESREYWCWNEHLCELESSRQMEDGHVRFRAIGPMMSADSSACLMTSESARAVFLPQSRADNKIKYISVFDYRATRYRADRTFGSYNMYPFRILDEFYAHLEMLMSRFENICLVIKSRPGDKLYSPRQEAILLKGHRFKEDGRLIVLDPDINPYIAIGIADLCIAIPFSSPVIAGLHFKRRGIFHDPFGEINHHSYHDLDSIISRGYDDLEEKIRHWLFTVTDKEFEEYLSGEKVKKFIGPVLGRDPALEIKEAI